MHSVISLEEQVTAALRPWRTESVVGIALSSRNSAELSCNLEYGTRSHDRIDKLALRRLNLTPTLRAAEIHNKDNEAIAALTSAPS